MVGNWTFQAAIRCLPWCFLASPLAVPTKVQYSIFRPSNRCERAGPLLFGMDVRWRTKLLPPPQRSPHNKFKKGTTLRIAAHKIGLGYTCPVNPEPHLGPRIRTITPQLVLDACTHSRIPKFHSYRSWIHDFTPESPLLAHPPHQPLKIQNKKITLRPRQMDTATETPPSRETRTTPTGLSLNRHSHSKTHDRRRPS